MQALSRRAPFVGLHCMPTHVGPSPGYYHTAGTARASTCSGAMRVSLAPSWWASCACGGPLCAAASRCSTGLGAGPGPGGSWVPTIVHLCRAPPPAPTTILAGPLELAGSGPGTVPGGGRRTVPQHPYEIRLWLLPGGRVHPNVDGGDPMGGRHHHVDRVPREQAYRRCILSPHFPPSWCVQRAPTADYETGATQ